MQCSDTRLSDVLFYDKWRSMFRPGAPSSDRTVWDWVIFICPLQTLMYANDPITTGTVCQKNETVYKNISPAGSTLFKGLRMVSFGLYKVSDQGTILRASCLYLHNARATIPKPFPNIDYYFNEENKTKLRQNKTWIEGDISCLTLTPNRYNALAPGVVYVSSDVTISGNFMTSQMNTIATQRTSLPANGNCQRFEIYGSALEHNSMFYSTRAKQWMFDSV